VVVGYEYGADDAPPERVKRAVLLLAKNWLVERDRSMTGRPGIPAGEAGTSHHACSRPASAVSPSAFPRSTQLSEQYRVKSGIYSLPLTRPENTYFDTAWPGW
jgi:hypothetical protein